MLGGREERREGETGEEEVCRVRKRERERGRGEEHMRV